MLVENSVPDYYHRVLRNPVMFISTPTLRIGPHRSSMWEALAWTRLCNALTKRLVVSLFYYHGK